MRVRTIFQLSFFLSLIFIFAITAPLFAADGYVMVGDNQTLTNYGTIAGDPGDDGVTSDDDNQTIVNYGTILGDTGINFCIGDTLAAGNDTIINSGTITGTGGMAIKMGDGDDTLTNNSTGILNGEVTMGRGNDALNNSGTIGEIWMGEGIDTITNSGTIEGNMGLGPDDDTATNNGIVGGDVYLGHGDDTFTNNGTVGDEVNGCGGNDTFTNNGTVENSVYLGSGNDTFTNNGTVQDNVRMCGDSDTFTNNGTVGGWVHMGGDNDTLTNNGTINGTVDMACDDDVLNLMSGSVVNDDIDGGSDDDTINLDGEGTFDHDIDDFEFLNKTGAGTWTLNGDVVVDTTGTIAAGTLLLNGTMGNGLALTVDHGATLGGTGTITGNVTNNGTLSPGNSIGTMTITGNYTQNAGSTLGVEVDSTTADLVDISGMATITGGTVAVTLLGSPADGATYDILTAAGGHTGAASFDGVTTSDSVVVSFTLDDTITANTISLVTVRTPYANVLTGAYSGQRDFAAALQAALPSATGALADWLLILDQSSSEAEFAQKLMELNPELYGALADIMGVEINLFNGVITTRMANVRESGNQFAGVSNVMTDSGPVMANVIAPSRTASGWSGWAQGFGIFADQDSDKGNVGFDYDTFGFAFGIDKLLGNNLLLGFSAGTAQTDVDYKDVTSDTDADTVHLGLYGTYSTERYYVDACALYASNSYETDRNIGIGTLNSDHDGHDFLVYFGGGYYYHVGEWDLIPTASLEYSYHDEDFFTEFLAGAPFMRVSDFDTDSVMSRLGFRLGRVFMVQDMKLRGEVRAQWAHELADTDRQVRARFAGSTAGSFTVDGNEPDRDSAILGVGVTAYATEKLSLYFNYDAELRSDFDAHHVGIGLRFDF